MCVGIRRSRAWTVINLSIVSKSGNYRRPIGHVFQLLSHSIQLHNQIIARELLYLETSRNQPGFNLHFISPSLSCGLSGSGFHGREHFIGVARRLCMGHTWCRTQRWQNPWRLGCWTAPPTASIFTSTKNFPCSSHCCSDAALQIILYPKGGEVGRIGCAPIELNLLQLPHWFMFAVPRKPLTAFWHSLSKRTSPSRHVSSGSLDRAATTAMLWQASWRIMRSRRRRPLALDNLFLACTLAARPCSAGCVPKLSPSSFAPIVDIYIYIVFLENCGSSKTTVGSVILKLFNFAILQHSALWSMPETCALRSSARYSKIIGSSRGHHVPEVELSCWRLSMVFGYILKYTKTMRALHHVGALRGAHTGQWCQDN